MKKLRIPKLDKNWDIRPVWLVLAGLVLLGAKLLLFTSQRAFLWPDEAVWDDMVMYNGAVSITEGGWLGVYGFKTLAKHSLFSLWLAGTHQLGISYLMAGQLLWAGAAMATAWAVAPVFKRRWPVLLLYAVLLFNPASVANPQPYAFIARPYRDNIFPSLCLLTIAGMVGFALRYRQPAKRWLGWLVMAGLGFAACRLCREDGWWLAPFLVGAAFVSLVFILRDGVLDAKNKWLRTLALLLPVVLMIGGVSAWKAANKAVYGRFIVSDFSSGDFADAYGAMTRIEHENWHPKVAVPRDVRMQLYALVPEFARLEKHLEGESFLNRYAGDEEYSSGAFYLALREAAALEGIYDTPETARLYFEGLARDINYLCDTGVLKAGPRRSSVSPPIRSEYILPVLGEGMYSLWFCATFTDCDARAMFSPASNDPVFYDETIRPMEEFLHQRALTATKENSTDPYFTPWQRLCFLAFDIIRVVYTVLLLPALAAALMWQVWQGIKLAGLLRRRQRLGQAGLVWLVCLGLLCCMLLRVFMIAFVSVSSFTIGTFVMYLSTVHPLMLLYAFLGVTGLLALLAARRKNAGVAA